MRILILFLFATLVCACSDNEPPQKQEFRGRKVLVLNEGNFAWGEGTLSLYSPDSGDLQNEVYKTKNGEALGNVLQSVSKIGLSYYFVVNNSKKIVITDLDFQKIGEIDGFTSPRYINQVSQSKAYVTDLFANKVWVVDLDQAQITSSIELNGWCETVAIDGELCYVTNLSSDKVYVIDVTTDQLSDSFNVNYAPQSLFIRDNVLWVLSQGGNGDVAQLAKLDLNSGEKLDSLDFGGAIPSHLRWSGESGKLYCLQEDLIAIDPIGLNVEKLSLGLSTPYAFDIDPNNGDLYISDALDYVQQSTILRLNALAQEKDRFKAGIITVGFHFE